MENDCRPRRGLFLKVLGGYAAVTLLVILLIGAVSFYLAGENVVRTNLKDLETKAQELSKLLAQPDGRVRVLTPKGLREIETLANAQLIYVDSQMQTRQMPTASWRRRRAMQAAWGDEGEDAADTGRPQPPQDFISFMDEMPPSAKKALEDWKSKEAQEGLTPREEDQLMRLNLAGSVDEQLILSIMGGQSATDIRQLQFVDEPMMFAGAPITDGETGSVLAAIILCRPVAQANETAGAMLRLIAMAGLAAMVCAALVAWFVSGRIARPIEEMSAVARQMALGSYGKRCRVRSRDEIGQLGDTLNLLSDRVREVIANLTHEKGRLEKILSSIGDGVIAVDREGRVIHRNGAALNLLGLKAREVRQDTPGALQHEELMEMVKDCMARREKVTTSWQTVTGRTIQAAASPLLDGQGQAISAVCLIRDISEEQKLEQMRRDYIANISHELRTPLTGIRGMTEPLLDGLMETEEERQACYRVIHQETIRLEKLIGEMLDLSRMQSGRIELELESMNAGALLQAAAGRMSARARDGQVELAVEGPDDLMVMGDENRILQVLIILLDNALAFTPPGGKVTLFARAGRDDWVEMGVKDTGSGIDPEDLPYIWERFYKADRARMGTGGTGLGLSIARMAVELMQGKIDVETTPGEGSTFTFTLKKG